MSVSPNSSSDWSTVRSLGSAAAAVQVDDEEEMPPSDQQPTADSGSGVRRTSTDDHEAIKRMREAIDGARLRGADLHACSAKLDTASARDKRKELERRAAEQHPDIELDLLQTGEYPLPA